MYDALANKTKNKMIFNRVEKIKKLKEDISILQEKLQKLEAQQEPQMTLKKSGDCDVISYDHKYYYRLSFGVGDFYWYKRYVGSSNLMKVEDPEEHRLLEELYDDAMLDTGGLVLEQGTWNYDPDAKIRKLAEKLLPDDHPYKIADEHGELNPYKQGLNMIKKDKETEELMTSKGYEKNSAGFWEPKPQNEEEVAEGLKSAFREAVKQGVVSSVDEPKESWMDKPIDELVDMLEKNPPKCLEFQLGKTLEQLIERWWCDVFTSKKYDWDMETAIQDLCDRIFLWLPKEQDSSGTQRIETIVAVDTHNELLRKIKSKIHNKKV